MHWHGQRPQMARHWHQQRQQKPSPWIALGVIFFCLYLSNYINSLRVESTGVDSVSNISSDTESTQSLNSMERWVYEQMNNHRAAKGLPPLILDDWLTMQAREHSQAMSSDKVPFDRQSLQQRNQEIMNAGSYQGVSTIIGMTQGYINPAQANVSNWLKDGDVNLTSIEGEYKLTGVGVAMNLRGEYYFTQVFLR